MDSLSVLVSDEMLQADWLKTAAIKLPRVRRPGALGVLGDLHLPRGMSHGPQPFKLDRPRGRKPPYASAVGGATKPTPKPTPANAAFERPPTEATVDKLIPTKLPNPLDIGPAGAPDSATMEFGNLAQPTSGMQRAGRSLKDFGARVNNTVIAAGKKMPIATPLALAGAAAVPVIRGATSSQDYAPWSSPAASSPISANSPVAPTGPSLLDQTVNALPKSWQPTAQATGGHLQKYWPAYATGGLGLLALVNAMGRRKRSRRDMEKVSLDFAAQHPLVAGFLVKCGEARYTNGQVRAHVIMACHIEPGLRPIFVAASEHELMKTAGPPLLGSAAPLASSQPAATPLAAPAAGTDVYDQMKRQSLNMRGVTNTLAQNAAMAKSGPKINPRPIAGPKWPDRTHAELTGQPYNYKPPQSSLQAAGNLVNNGFGALGDVAIDAVNVGAGLAYGAQGAGIRGINAIGRPWEQGNPETADTIARSAWQTADHAGADFMQRLQHPLSENRSTVHEFYNRAAKDADQAGFHPLVGQGLRVIKPSVDALTGAAAMASIPGTGPAGPSSLRPGQAGVGGSAGAMSWQAAKQTASDAAAATLKSVPGAKPVLRAGAAMAGPAGAALYYGDKVMDVAQADMLMNRGRGVDATGKAIEPVVDRVYGETAAPVVADQATFSPAAQQQLEEAVQQSNASIDASPDMLPQQRVTAKQHARDTFINQIAQREKAAPKVPAAEIAPNPNADPLAEPTGNQQLASIDDNRPPGDVVGATNQPPAAQPGAAPAPGAAPPPAADAMSAGNAGVANQATPAMPDAELGALAQDQNAPPEVKQQAAQQALENTLAEQGQNTGMQPEEAKQYAAFMVSNGLKPEQATEGFERFKNQMAAADPNAGQDPSFFDQVSQAWMKMDTGQQALMVIGGGLGLLGLINALGGEGGVGDWLLAALGIGGAAAVGAGAGMFGKGPQQAVGAAGTSVQNMVGGFGQQLSTMLGFGQKPPAAAPGGQQPPAPGTPQPPAAGQNTNISQGDGGFAKLLQQNSWLKDFVGGGTDRSALDAGDAENVIGDWVKNKIVGSSLDPKGKPAVRLVTDPEMEQLVQSVKQSPEMKQQVVASVQKRLQDPELPLQAVPHLQRLLQMLGT